MDRFTAAIVAGVLLLVVAGVGTALVLQGRETPPDLATPSGVALAYELALQRGKPDRAWDLLAASVQARAERDQFLLRAGTHYREDRMRLLVEDERIEGDTARVDLVQVYPSSGGPFGLGGGSYSTRQNVQLVREDGAWRISVPPDPWLVLERD